MNEVDPVRETVRANTALAAAGQSDMVWGHASVRDPEGRGVWMKASGWGFEEIDADRVVLVSPDGEVLSGGGRRHIEYPIHTELLAARPDAGAVVHTHSTAAVAFAALDVPLRALSHDAVPFVRPDVPRFTGTGSLVMTRALGGELAAAVGEAAGCLVPQHGLVTVGPDAASAVMYAVLLDRACRTQLTAMAAGPLRRWSDDEEIARKLRETWPASQLHAGYRYLCRLAERTGRMGR
ncbi:class II aldolase/adducin family protein [Streptomyces sp. NPDC050560]|uniref:class II aldolase/adducin family protein n=1 Tax=Streptomyces sp. NPDC050560 TaxID=3365630 RepID=UPI0037936ADC